MTTIPLDWQGRLGGPALTGLGGAAIISCASSGVSARRLRLMIRKPQGYAGVRCRGRSFAREVNMENPS